MTCLASGAAIVPPCPCVRSTVTAIAISGSSSGANAMNHAWFEAGGAVDGGAIVEVYAQPVADVVGIEDAFEGGALELEAELAEFCAEELHRLAMEVRQSIPCGAGRAVRPRTSRRSSRRPPSAATPANRILTRGRDPWTGP